MYSTHSHCQSMYVGRYIYMLFLWVPINPFNILYNVFIFGSIKTLLHAFRCKWNILTAVTTPKHPNFCEDQILIIINNPCVCLVDADPIAIKFPGTRDVYLDNIQFLKLLVTNVIIAYDTTFTDTNLKVF